MDQSGFSTFTVLPTATLLEASKVVEKNKSRTVIVVESIETNKVLGVLSEGDILRALIGGAGIHTNISDHMQVSFAYLSEPDAQKALTLFRQHGFGLIPVVDSSMHLTSVVTLLDCLRTL